MKKTYELTGMNCGGCVNTVKQVLHQVPGVNRVEVQLNPQKASLELSKAVDVAELQSQLSKRGNYTIKETV